MYVRRPLACSGIRINGLPWSFRDLGLSDAGRHGAERNLPLAAGLQADPESLGGRSEDRGHLPALSHGGDLEAVLLPMAFDAPGKVRHLSSEAIVPT
jgi:hypothetical protein